VEKNFGIKKCGSLFDLIGALMAEERVPFMVQIHRVGEPCEYEINRRDSNCQRVGFIFDMVDRDKHQKIYGNRGWRFRGQVAVVEDGSVDFGLTVGMEVTGGFLIDGEGGSIQVK